MDIKTEALPIIDKDNLTPTQKKAHNAILGAFTTPMEQGGILVSKTANQWIREAKNRPIPRMLFGELWYEGELSVLYASSNVGKSILAVQIAESIARGEDIAPLRMEADPQPVLYFDFELSDKQFETRYSKDYREHYSFSEYLIRVEIDPEADVPREQDFNEIINSEIERAILRHGAKVLIVDNITYLKTETEKSKDAIPLMKHLKRLKSKHGLSILALAHTPKRDSSRPIELQDLAGSAHLGNFVDSAFAIGKSGQDKSLRYVKQVKERSCPKVYGSDNVLIFELHKPSNMVRFDFREYGNEDDHLATISAQDREDKKTMAQALKSEGKSFRDIADELGVGKSTVQRWVQPDEVSHF
jgi:RecA-family ATPase